MFHGDFVNVTLVTELKIETPASEGPGMRAHGSLPEGPAQFWGCRSGAGWSV